MKYKPINISMRKIQIYERRVGRPPSMELAHLIRKSVDPDLTETVEQQRKYWDNKKQTL